MTFDSKNTSSYLHSLYSNQVHWLAWSKETLLKAQQENKVIFLSIGSSSNFLCHKFSQEAFADTEIANTINNHFIPILLDRDLHSEIEAHFSEAVQAMGQVVAWPLNLFLSPQAKCFYSCSYHKKDNFMFIIEKIAQDWQEQSEKIISFSTDLHNRLGLLNEFIEAPSLDKNYYSLAKKAFLQDCDKNFDMNNYGYGNSPKFPACHIHKSMLAYVLNDELEQKYTNILDLSVRNMCRSALYDSISGGFFSYCSDPAWQFANFEKNLLLNTQILKNLVDSFRLQKKTYFQSVFAHSWQFIKKQLANEEHLYYQALASWSIPKGKHDLIDYQKNSLKLHPTEQIPGQNFYLWTMQDFEKLLNAKELEVFLQHFELVSSPEDWGNFSHDISSLHLLWRNNCDFSTRFKNDIKDILILIENHRNQRAKLFLDENQSFYSNAHLLSVLCYAHTHLSTAHGQEGQAGLTSKNISEQEISYLQEAIDIYSALKKHFMPNMQIKKMRYKQDLLDKNGQLEDYAIWVRACLDLFLASQNESYLQEALLWQRMQDRIFLDPKTNAYYSENTQDLNLAFRRIEFYDTQSANSNSLIANNLLDLNSFFKIEDFYHRALQITAAASSAAIQHPFAYASHFYHSSLLDYSEESSKYSQRKIIYYYFANKAESQVFREKIVFDLKEKDLCIELDLEQNYAVEELRSKQVYIKNNLNYSQIYWIENAGQLMGPYTISQDFWKQYESLA